MITRWAKKMNDGTLEIFSEHFSINMDKDIVSGKISLSDLKQRRLVHVEVKIL